jgi:DNA-binding NarL/FixJ family response regulator
MPPEDRRLLEMWESGLTAPEIAKKLNRPSGSVRFRKHRLKALTERDGPRT